MHIINPAIVSEFIFKTSRSGGKGGQHVNKIESKVEFSFDISSSKFLSEEQKHFIILKLKNKIDNEGFLHMTESRDRSQYTNKEQLVKKALKLMASVSLKPKKRLPTKATKASQRKRVDEKKRISDVKKTRNKQIDF